MIVSDLPLFPPQASTLAPKTDALLFFLLAVAGFFSALIFTLIFYFAIRFRRRNDLERPRPVPTAMWLEATWTVIPLMLVCVMFVWGASLYYREYTPPPGALEIYVVGKQWMWKLQHPGGQREINELHVPTGRPVKLIMTSQDVIHSFFLPAFRIKQDVLPGRYTSEWFEATKTGTYHLFCAEYCGDQHSHMIGRLVVMEPREYERWLSGAGAGESLQATGRKLFERLGCVNCHKSDASGRCPVLEGIFNKPVALSDGRTVIADEAYIRESILDPGAKIVAGYPNIMPTFQGLVTEEGLIQLISYVKSLRREGAAGTTTQPEVTPQSGLNERKMEREKK
jgi:cytochrome c oxidase subunit II